MTDKAVTDSEKGEVLEILAPHVQRYAELPLFEIKVAEAKSSTGQAILDGMIAEQLLPHDLLSKLVQTKVSVTLRVRPTND